MFSKKKISWQNIDERKNFFDTKFVLHFFDETKYFCKEEKVRLFTIFLQFSSFTPEHMVVPLLKKFGREFKRVMVFDRIAEEIKSFCANNTIDDVYNNQFLTIGPYVEEKATESISRLLNNSIKILNLVIPKPDIPDDIAENYKQVQIQFE